MWFRPYNPEDDQTAFRQNTQEVHDPRKPILISYLAAVSQFSQLIFDKLQDVAYSRSNELADFSSLMNGHSCFSTEFEGFFLNLHNFCVLRVNDIWRITSCYWLCK